MLCMATMQQLFKDGFVEKYGERGLRPPKVKRLSAEDGGFTESIIFEGGMFPTIFLLFGGS